MRENVGQHESDFTSTPAGGSTELQKFPFTPLIQVYVDLCEVYVPVDMLDICTCFTDVVIR